MAVDMYIGNRKLPLGSSGGILTRTAILEAIEVETKYGEIPEINISPYDIDRYLPIRFTICAAIFGSTCSVLADFIYIFINTPTS